MEFDSLNRAKHCVVYSNSKIAKKYFSLLNAVCMADAKRTHAYLPCPTSIDGYFQKGGGYNGIKHIKA